MEEVRKTYRGVFSRCLNTAPRRGMGGRQRPVGEANRLISPFADIHTAFRSPFRAEADMKPRGMTGRIVGKCPGGPIQPLLL